MDTTTAPGRRGSRIRIDPEGESARVAELDGLRGLAADSGPGVPHQAQPAALGMGGGRPLFRPIGISDHWDHYPAYEKSRVPPGVLRPERSTNLADLFSLRAGDRRSVSPTAKADELQAAAQHARIFAEYA